MQTWYVETLNGTSTEVTGRVTFDSELGLLEFSDDNNRRLAFFNLAALAYAAVIEDGESA